MDRKCRALLLSGTCVSSSALHPSLDAMACPEKVALETVSTGWTHVVPWLKAELLFCIELRLRLQQRVW